MKQVIKITLIAVVAITIGLVLFLSFKKLDPGTDEQIVTTPYEKHVQERTDNEVKGKEYSSAHSGYEAIMQEIKTEASITLGNGQKNLSDVEVLNSKKIVFYEYAPIFTQYGISYFNRSSWDDSTLKNLRNESSSLLDLKIAESRTDVFNDLNKIKKNVDEYYAAWKVSNSASHCTSVNEIATLKASADKYKHKPLTNNASLSAALNAVESNAKKSVVRVIVGLCSSVAQQYRNYSDYVSWTAAYNNACKRINEYKSKYGYPQELQSVRNKLDKADDDALGYYTTHQTD